jgi:hypothetical protein
MRPFLWLMPLVLLGGCDNADEPIKSYTANDPNRQEIRLLAAIFQARKDRALVFKLSGPKTEVDLRRDEFLAFIDSFQRQHPERWKLPADWIPQQGGELRPLWYYIPGRKMPLECTFSPLQGEKATSVVLNVQRWRRQMLLPPLEVKDFDEPLVEFKRIDDMDVAIIDMVGYGDYTPPASPAAVEPPPPPPSLPFQYTLPKDWEIVPERRPAIVLVIQAGAKTEVTLSKLPGDAGGVLANVNRWRGQLRLPPASDLAEARKTMSKLRTPLAEMELVDLHNPEKTGANRFAIGFFTLGNDTWFVKMSGPSTEVLAARDTLREFLESFKMD